MPGTRRADLAGLVALLRRFRPSSQVVVVFATVLVGAGVTAAVVMAVQANSDQRPQAVAGLGGLNPLGSWPPVSVAPSPTSAATSAAGSARPTSRPARPSATRATASTAASRAAPPAVHTYEAESSVNTLAGGAATMSCAPCSGGSLVASVGFNATLQFNAVRSASAGSATLTIWYTNGDATRRAQITVNGTASAWADFAGTGGWTTVQAVTVTIPVIQGANEITLSNSGAWAPYFDKISVRDPAR